MKKAPVRKQKKPTPIATAKEVDDTINKICSFHGYRREKWDETSHVVFGLRGPAGALALDLIKALKFTALNGTLPKYAEPAAKEKAS